MHLPPIVEDLAVILIVAGAMTLLFRAIRQPAVLGYLIAGFLVGPHFKWLPTILDTESVKVWAELGVIFLLFALGLEFSFKKLVRVGPPASITAFVEVAGMVVIGFLLGRAFGWTNYDSVFLGGILAISSTTIIIRAFDELEMKTRGFVRLVFGVLIVEDLVAILLLVMLSTIAVSQNFSGVEMGISVLKLFFFLTLWFVLGIFLLPSFLGRVQKFLGAETLLVVSLGLCFLMVVLATKAGFSPALGAFIMGSILAETMQGERIERLIQPIKDLFGAIFFVSVGMLIDPQVLAKYWFPVLIITLVTIFGKFFTTAAGALLAGQSLRHSVQAGLSLAQIGEFSFIIAGLGLSLRVTSDFLYPIAISVSAVTTFTTPYLIRSNDTIVGWLERKLPPKTIAALERFRVVSANVSQRDDWRVFLRRSIVKVATNGVVVTAIFLIVSEFAKPWLEAQFSPNLKLAHSISLTMAFLAAAPFLWAIVGGRHAGGEARSLWSERRFMRALVLFEVARWVFAIVLCAILAGRIVSPGIVIVLMCALLIFGVYFFSGSFETIYLRLERRFIHNLNEKEVSEKRTDLPTLAPWDSHLAELRISADSPMVGHKLCDLMLRERFGVTIAMIERGRRKIPAPGRADMIYPGDVLQVIGTDDQIRKFAAECDSGEPVDESDRLDYVLRPIYVEPDSPYANKSIRECGLRERTHGLVVGIEKGGQRTLNPDSATIIEPGNVLWVVGDQNLITGL